MKVKIKNVKIVNPPQNKPQGPEPQKGPAPQTEPQPPNVEEFNSKPPKGGGKGGDGEEEKNDKPSSEGGDESEPKDSEDKDESSKGGGDSGEQGEEEKEETGQGKKPQETKVKRVTVPKNPKPIKAPNEDDQYEPNVDKGQSQEEKEKEISDKITKAYDQTMRENAGGSERGTGSGSGVGKMFKKDIYKTKTDWKTLLRNFIGGLPRIEQTWNRPASRYWAGMGQYMPSEKLVKDTLDLVIAIDTSGSISSQQIHTFLNEVSTIVSATKRVKLKVLFWMDDVYSETDVDSKTMGLEAIKQKLQNIPIRNDGGTTISSVKNYLSSKGIKKIEGLIYFTDGWVEPSPQIPRVEKNRVIFMITPGGNTTIVSKLGIGRVVEVDIK